MKNSITKLSLAFIMLFSGLTMYAQLPSIQYFRYNDKRGLNVFETGKEDTVKYEGLRVRVGGDFAVQFQGLSQSNDLVGDTLVDLTSNFALPTANLNINAQLEDGLRMHLRVWLSSRHHAEAWVKGGYIQMDKLDFISPGFLSGFMDIATIRIGMDEINYGDTHFRRTDNARSLFNPFVGNYIMDAFTTEPFFEVTLQSNGLLGVIGASNGRLNQDPVDGDNGRVLYGKLGYDKQLNDDLRFRLTGSYYTSTEDGTRDYLYGGDRAGARYYNVLNGINEARPSDFEPRFNPSFSRAPAGGYLNAFMINPFVKYQGLEFFGVFEVTNNGNDAVGGSYTHTGAELLYRFGSNEQVYVGGRYNSVSGEEADGAPAQEIDRINLGLGWFMTQNMMLKAEYVTSSYEGDGFAGTKLQGAEFDGFMIEAVIGF